MKEMNEEVSRDRSDVWALILSLEKQAVSHGDSGYNLELSAPAWWH
jgi:hypothetical protein